MRHIRYYNTSPSKEEDKKEDEIVKKDKGFFSSMSKTTKYILIILLVLFILLIFYLIYRSGKKTSVEVLQHSSNSNDYTTNSKSIKASDISLDRDIDIASNASYNEVMSSSSVSEAGTIDDIIINNEKTGMPVGNLRYVYF
jgi:hypothetical protein